MLVACGRGLTTRTTRLEVEMKFCLESKREDKTCPLKGTGECFKTTKCPTDTKHKEDPK